METEFRPVSSIEDVQISFTNFLLLLILNAIHPLSWGPLINIFLAYYLYTLMEHSIGTIERKIKDFFKEIFNGKKDR